MTNFNTAEPEVEQRPRKRRAWTDKSFLEEMLSFTLLMDHMPTHHELVRAGRGDLAAQVPKRGGYPAVAEAIGLPNRGKRSDAAIEREVLDLAGSSGRFPEAREFARAGKSGIRESIMNRGGVEAWADRLGLERPRGPLKWDEESIRRALKGLIGFGVLWPSQREFREAGLSGLEGAIGHGEERERWAEELGVTVVKTRVDDEDFELELKEFTEGMTDFPTRRQFAEAGLDRLLATIRRRGGPEVWAERLGLSFEGSGQGVKKRFYDTHGFVEEMRRFCEGRETFPTQPELIAAGRGDLLTQVRKHGGFPAAAELVGIPATGHGRSDEKIESELRDLVGDSDLFPSFAEFKAAGKSGLYACIGRNGGSSAWAEKIGVEPPRRRRRPRGAPVA